MAGSSTPIPPSIASTSNVPGNDIELVDRSTTSKAQQTRQAQTRQAQFRREQLKLEAGKKSVTPQQGEPSSRLREGQQVPNPVTAENAPDRLDFVVDIPEGTYETMTAEAQTAALEAASKELVEHERRQLNPQHVQEFFEERKKAIKSGDYTLARQKFFQVHDLTGDAYTEAVKGWQNAGGVYATRQIPGALWTTWPAAFLFGAEHFRGGDPKWAELVFKSVYFATVSGTAVTHPAISDFTLLHVTPQQDLMFNPKIDIIPELKTPGFADIVKELDAVLDDATNQVPQIRALLQAAVDGPEDPGKREAAQEAFSSTMDKLQKGMTNYMTRCMLNGVYFEGLSNTAFIQSVKLYCNLCAPWVGFATDSLRNAAYFQLASTLVQLVATYYAAKGDKVNEQLAMVDLKIMTSDSEEKLKAAVHNPLQVRANALSNMYTIHLKELDQQISDKLGLASPNEWREYKALEGRAEHAAAIAPLKATVDGAVAGLDAETGAEVAQLRAAQAKLRKEHDYDKADELCEQIAGHLGMPANDAKKFFDLESRAAALPPLTHADQARRTVLQAQVTAGRMAIPSSEEQAALDKLVADWSLAQHDSRLVKERRFKEVSSYDGHLDLTEKALEITKDPSPIRQMIKPSNEFEVGLLDGHSRSKAPDQTGATYAASAWKAFQLGLAGPNGFMMFNALLMLLNAIQTLKDPEHETPVWQRAMSTSIVGFTLLANMVAALAIVSAKAKPLSLKMYLQVLAGSTGSIAEGTYQNWKLRFREGVQNAIKAGQFPRVGAAAYIWNPIKMGFQGLAALPTEAIQANKARVRFNKATQLQQDLLQLGRDFAEQFPELQALPAGVVADALEEDVTEIINEEMAAAGIDEAPLLQDREAIPLRERPSKP